MFFFDELYSFMILFINKNKVKKWIVIIIEMIEKDIWVNICFKVEKIIKIMKKVWVLRFYGMEIRNEIYFYYRIYFIFFRRYYVVIWIWIEMF